MKTFNEIEAAVEAKVSTEQKLCLIFEWVKTGVMNKNQFVSIVSVMQQQAVDEAVAMVEIINAPGC